MPDLKSFLQRPVTAVTDWLNSHKEFIAVHFTRFLAVVFMGVAAVFLAKSLGML